MPLINFGEMKDRLSDEREPGADDDDDDEDPVGSSRSSRNVENSLTSLSCQARAGFSNAQ